MILRAAKFPQAKSSGGNMRAVPVWNAVFVTQKQPAGWFITQPDHARLAGAIARNLAPLIFPSLDDDIIEAISLHDEGWRLLDASGSVRSFLDVQPADFLPAWLGSITAGEQVSQRAGVVVSGHFCRLAKVRLKFTQHGAAEILLLREFLEKESLRRSRLHVPAREIESLTDLLQFCDVFSLYLCSGASEPVHFPQNFATQALEVRQEHGEYTSTPAFFRSPTAFEVRATPVTTRDTRAEPVRLEFKLR